MDTLKIGQRIKEERLQLRLTQEKLAEESMLNESYIGQIERGAKKPSLESIIKIASVLGVTIDYLLQDSVEVKKTALLDELVSVAASKDDEEIRLLLNINRLVTDYIQKKSNK